jgi:YebC/PmpR family DNA-binding regulatory protein
LLLRAAVCWNPATGRRPVQRLIPDDMAGHNRWTKIKRAKGAADAKRGKVFSKLARELIVAAKEGGGDPAHNARLRMVIMKCKAASLPADNIERAIAKATGGGEGVTFDQLTYEIFGPGGVALLVEVSTDNRNRTAADVRHLATRHGGNIATPGAVSRLFQRRGQLIVARDRADEETLMSLAVEAGAEDFKADENGYEILIDPANFEAAHQQLERHQIPCEVAEVTQLPLTTVPVADAATARALTELIDLLDDHDDVKSVAHNAELPPGD